MQQYRAMKVHLPGGDKVTVDAHTYVWNRPGPKSAEKALAMWGKIRRRLESLSPASGGKTAHVPKPTKPSFAQGLEGAMAFAGRSMNSPIGTVLAGFATGVMNAISEIQVNPMQDIRNMGRPLRFVPYGKGSPEMIAAYLRLAVMAGVVKPHALQQFLDDRYVGIDCSGFVSNYLAAIGKMDKTVVGDYNAASYASGHPKRKSLDELANLDILVWRDGGHVAIMEEPKKGTGGIEAVVVESNGSRGLDKETYTFESVDKSGIFTVKRANGKSQSVRIFDWNLDV
jgi:hypothetical protein